MVTEDSVIGKARHTSIGYVSRPDGIQIVFLSRRSRRDMDVDPGGRNAPVAAAQGFLAPRSGDTASGDFSPWCTRGGFRYTEIERYWQLTPTGKYWGDLALLTEYEQPVRRGDAKSFTFGPLAQVEFGEIAGFSALRTLNLL